MSTVIPKYNNFLDEANDNLTDVAKHNLKADALKDKIKNNFDQT